VIINIFKAEILVDHKLLRSDFAVTTDSVLAAYLGYTLRMKTLFRG